MGRLHRVLHVRRGRAMKARCVVCHTRKDVDAFYAVHEDAVAGTAHACSVECDDVLQTDWTAIMFHPQREAFDVLDEWEDRFEDEGSESPLPMSLVEDEHPHLFDFFTELLTEAFDLVAARPTDFGEEAWWDQDSFQGYHDEWPPIIAAAREILS